MMNRFLRVIAVFIVISTFTNLFGQNSAIRRELNQLNTKINRENERVDSLGTQIRLLLPELQNALKANLKAKE